MVLQWGEMIDILWVLIRFLVSSPVEIRERTGAGGQTEATRRARVEGDSVVVLNVDLIAWRALSPTIWIYLSFNKDDLTWFDVRISAQTLLAPTLSVESFYIQIENWVNAIKYLRLDRGLFRQLTLFPLPLNGRCSSILSSKNSLGSYGSANLLLCTFCWL